MKLSVLIAEDDALVRFTMREALESAGHNVEAVADGQEAIGRARQVAEMEANRGGALTLSPQELGGEVAHGALAILDRHEECVSGRLQQSGDTGDLTGRQIRGLRAGARTGGADELVGSPDRRGPGGTTRRGRSG